jgi:hypothetical protein
MKVYYSSCQLIENQQQKRGRRSIIGTPIKLGIFIFFPNFY